MSSKDRVTPAGPPYKAVNNAALMRALFWELDAIDPHPTYNPVFCLFGEKPGMISCQNTFLELRDPTGYKWAMKYLKDWNHFKRLLKTSYFGDAYKTWSDQLSTMLRQEAVEKVQKLMGSDKETISLAAAKYIAEEGWKEKPKAASKRGRPSKAEVKGKLEEEVKLSKEETEDLKRIGLVVDNTKKKA